MSKLKSWFNKFHLPVFCIPKPRLPKFPKFSLPKLKFPEVEAPAVLSSISGFARRNWRFTVISLVILAGVWVAGFYTGMKELSIQEIQAALAKPIVTMVATVDDLNVRSGPGKSYSVVGQLDVGDQVSVKDRVSNADGEWCNIEYKGQSAFVFCRYLKKGG